MPMRSPLTIRRSLLVSVLTLNLVSLGLLLALMFFGSRYVVSYLATSIIDETQANIQLQVQTLFTDVTNELDRIATWVDQGLVDLDEPDELNRLLKASFKQQDQIAAIVIANQAGREHMLLKNESSWQMRRTQGDVSDHMFTIWRWDENPRSPEIKNKLLEYDPRTRPWFMGAMKIRSERRPQTEPVTNSQLVHWTNPYRFFTTHLPGVTASITAMSPQGQMYVIAIDLTLKEISRYTTKMVVGTRGMVMVLTGVDENFRTDLSVIGLPHAQKFLNVQDQDQYLLKRPEELDLKVLNDAIETMKVDPSQRGKSIRFYSSGEYWWGTGQLSPLGEQLHVATAILIPESDIMGEIQWVQKVVWGILVLIFVASVYHVIKLARQFSQPIECLVQDMKRVSRGVLDEPCRVKSDVREFASLAQAHENMRQSLQSLMKLERDMQLARQIQQKTFPARLPAVNGFEIDAWSQPADETGGDTYDIIGLKVRDDQLVICEDQPEKILFLLADATGHGIGPALSVTQLRAMLRMTVWSNVLDINTIQHINDQMIRDLPEGRFVTAWLGSLDTTTDRKST
ncbi:MAG: SpoIIE family protein phosphatase, partial [Phycisphaeraceae bacterium JB051]